MGTLHIFLLVAAGGAAGSMLRYAAGTWFGAQALTTFAVNVSGAFLIGFLVAFTEDPRWRVLLGTGFLGGYTTFSTWQLEALRSALAGEWQYVGLHLVGSTVAGLAAVALGYALAVRLQ